MDTERSRSRRPSERAPSALDRPPGCRGGARPRGRSPGPERSPAGPDRSRGARRSPRRPRVPPGRGPAASVPRRGGAAPTRPGPGRGSGAAALTWAQAPPGAADGAGGGPGLSPAPRPPRAPLPPASASAVNKPLRHFRQPGPPHRMPSAFPLGNTDRAGTLRPPRGTGELRQLRAALLPAGPGAGTPRGAVALTSRGAGRAHRRLTPPRDGRGGRGRRRRAGRWRRGRGSAPPAGAAFPAGAVARRAGSGRHVAVAPEQVGAGPEGVRGAVRRSLARLLTHSRPPLPLRIADFQEVLGEPTVALDKLRDLCFSGEWGGGGGSGGAQRSVWPRPPLPLPSPNFGAAAPAGAEPYPAMTTASLLSRRNPV